MKPVSVLLLLLGYVTAIQGGTFVNLGFDDANTNGVVSFGEAPTPQLLPGWTLFYGTNEVESLGFDKVLTLTPRNASLVSEQTRFISGFTPEGKYALLLNPEISFDTPSFSRTYQLVQRGEIPDDAVFLEYKFRKTGLSLFLDNREITPLTPLFPSVDRLTPHRALFDVSAYAGQEVTLRLSQIPNTSIIIDSVAFVVPEPGSLALGGMMTVLFFIRHRARQRGRQRTAGLVNCL